MPISGPTSTFQACRAVDGVERLAHLVLVENADHNPHGDFYIDEKGRVHEDHSARDQRLTFSGISVMHKNLFRDFPIQPRSMVPLLQEAMLDDQVSGEVFEGMWMDIGTPERLREINGLLDVASKADGAVRYVDGINQQSVPESADKAAQRFQRRGRSPIRWPRRTAAYRCDVYGIGATGEDGWPRDRGRNRLRRAGHEAHGVVW